MKVLAQLDPLVLERELLRRIGAAHGSSVGARTLIVVPTTRLGAHLQRRLAEERPAWLGVEVLHFRALALRIVDAAGDPAPRLLSPRLAEALPREIARAHPDNFWSRFAQARPGTVRRLAAAFDDLREAGIAPGELDAACRGEAEIALAELYRAHQARIASLVARKWVDEAGLVGAALPHAAAWAGTFGAAFLHGAYELIGVHLELLREIDRGVPVTVLLPAAPGTAASAYAEGFGKKCLPASAEVEPIPGPLPIEQRPALHALYDESSRPRAAHTFGFRHAQGAAAEVAAAVREALAAVRDGCPPSEIAIVARSLAPFAAAIEEAFEDQGLPFTSSLAAPLRRWPICRDFLQVVHVVGEDFPRASTAALLRSPRLAWSAVLEGSRPPAGVLADVWSRRARVIGGLDEWTDDLPRWVRDTHGTPRRDEDAEEARLRGERREADARRIGRALAGLRDLVDPGARRWNEHAGRLARVLTTLFPAAAQAEQTGAAEMLVELLDDMARLATVLGDTRRVPYLEMAAWLDEAVGAAELPLGGGDGGGVRVLDAMQARGLTFSRVHLMGMNAGLFPRTPREDPVLRDGLRRRLREATSKPLPLKSEGAGEERLLLALLLGSGSQRVDLSWQRADESGRARTPSLALREVARIASGVPDLDGLRARARHLPSHPTHWLEALAAEPALLAPHEERLLLALASGGPATAGEVLGDRPELRSGLRMLAATQAFRAVDPAFDAAVGPITIGTLSVSALDKLGGCPLQFFFANVLRVQELEEAANAYEIEAKEQGTQLHAVLERTYRVLAEERLLGEGDPEIARQRAVALLHAERASILGVLDTKLARRLPVLHRRITDNWLGVLERFVARDLARLREGGWRPADFEQTVELPLDFGAGIVATVRGRFDRTFAGDGKLVGDYKVSKSLDWRTNSTGMLKGTALQVPLYAMLAGENATVELLGLHPTFKYDDDEAKWHKTFTGFNTAGADGFRETLRVLLGFVSHGVFPFSESIRCTWCPYARACRRDHPPSQVRQEESEAGRRLAALRDKSTKKPRLADVEAAS